MATISLSTEIDNRLQLKPTKNSAKNLVPAFILEQFSAGNLRGKFSATTLFVDISGFTTLTESLMRHGTEGAEILSDILDSIFAPMVALVSAHGGSIPHFAGDAFTAIFPEQPAQTVAFIALSFRNRFDETTLWHTKFGDFRINLRVGLSYGSVEWGVVGVSPKTFYFRGAAIDQAAAAEQQAEPQQVVFDRSFLTVFTANNAANIEDFEKSPDVLYTNITPNFFELNNLPSPDLSGQAPSIKPVLQEKKVKNTVSNHSAIQQFLPASVLEFNEKAEFRDVISIFISFDNVKTHDDLAVFTTIVLAQFTAFGGYFKELDFGDKGGLMVGFFGAPTAYENNLNRSLECLLAIKDAVSHLQAKRPLRFRVGVTSGVAYTGIIGGVERCQYAIVGTQVNLAARFALAAVWGEIVVDKHVLHAKSFEFAAKGDVTYKGFAEKIPTFKLVKKKIEEKPIFGGVMVGRDAELATIVASATTTLGGSTGGVVYVWGEAGIGKSRLTYELREQLESVLKLNWAVCQSDQILKKPFNPFLYYLKNYFKQSVEHTPTENVDNFEHTFQALARSLPESAYTEGAELMRTRSILAALAGLNFADSLWEQLDARGRYDNTFAAIENLFLSLSQVRPLVIELEDGHWFDADSTALVKNLVRKIQDAPILLLTTSRYDDENAKNALVEPEILRGDKIKFSEIDLNNLSPKGLKQLAETKLRGRIHDDLADMLTRSTNGNPFYAEQILAYFMENNLLQSVDNQWTVKDKTVKISNSISAILTARIDRLSSILKETVKAAAVIGREFELPVLSEVILQHAEYLQRNGNSQIVLREQIQNAEKGQIWRAMNELRYIFRHSLLRETVYDMQMRTRLRELHFMIAKAIEKVYADSIEQRYVDLAFHYEQAEIKLKTNEYLQKAADFARRNFQNIQALEFYDRLLKNSDDETEVVKTLVKKGEVLQLIGRWTESEINFHSALFKSAATGNLPLKGRTHNALGALLLLKGNYKDARIYLEKAAAYSEQIVDSQGTARAYGNLGNLYFRQGDYSLAKDYFLKSIQIARDNGLRIQPQIVSNLGLTFMNQGNYTEGVIVQKEELELVESVGDLGAAATLWVNLGIVYFEKGDIDGALPCFEKGLELCQLLGNKQFTSIALGCIGNVWRVKGNIEKATDFLADDLKICLELGDKQGIAIAHELIGRLNLTKGEPVLALQHFEESIKLCRQLNYQKGIAKALQGAGEATALYNEFLKAIFHFEEAADIARKINNQLILGQTLVEMGRIFLRVGDVEKINLVQTEAIAVAESLGNEKLTTQVADFLKKI
ncbi:MAG: tetratricopeptide repeat protein [Saprospiraceae bacterium]|nr:tetratricopeptide repeat protein [Saprospiraceae bacterium]